MQNYLQDAAIIILISLLTITIEKKISIEEARVKIKVGFIIGEM